MKYREAIQNTVKASKALWEDAKEMAIDPRERWGMARFMGGSLLACSAFGELVSWGAHAEGSMAQYGAMGLGSIALTGIGNARLHTVKTSMAHQERTVDLLAVQAMRPQRSAQETEVTYPVSDDNLSSPLSEAA